MRGWHRKAIFVGATLLAAASIPASAFADEPADWTRYKQDCRRGGGQIADTYNEAMAAGGCHQLSPRPPPRRTDAPAQPPPPPQPTPEELARARALQLKQQAEQADNEGQAAASRGDWDGAIAKYNEALSDDPGNAAILQHLATARNRRADSQLAPQIDEFRRQNRDAEAAAEIDAFRKGDRAGAWSPSTDLLPWIRQDFERQFTILEARRFDAEAELAKIDALAPGVHADMAENQRVIDELAEDSVSDTLDVLQGIFALCGEEVPAPAKQEIDLLLNASQLTAHGSWAMRANPGSERQSAEALSALANFTGMLTVVPPAGVKPETWEALRYSVGDMRKLLKAADGSTHFPTDGPGLTRLLNATDQIIGIAGSLPRVGPAIAGAHAAGHLAPFNLPHALYRLMGDRRELGTASVHIQSARRFWITRIGEIKAQEAPYRASLGIKPD
jgi:hypothetical protein